jgi:hypothetical protein
MTTGPVTPVTDGAMAGVPRSAAGLGSGVFAVVNHIVSFLACRNAHERTALPITSAGRFWP